MTPDQERQYREDFESMRSSQSTMSVSFNILQKKTACGDYEDFATQVAWMGYLSARKKAQEEIDRLSNRNAQLEDFCNEFVYGEENPEYYSTMTDKLKEREKEISQLKEEFEKLHSFCLNYQIYIHDILHSVNVFKSFHDLRKGAHAYAASMDKDPKWDYQDTENTDYFNGLKSYVEQLKEQISSIKEIKQYPTALTYISELKEELKRERSAVDFCAKDLTYQSAELARQTQQQRRIDL